MITPIILGTDMVFLPRLETADRRLGERFFQTLLTPEELAYCQECVRGNRKQGFYQRAGSRIAAKEAVAKALGTGLRGLGWPTGLPWQSIEVVSQRNSAPQLTLHGPANEEAMRQGIASWKVSLSHDGEYALAVVLSQTVTSPLS